VACGISAQRGQRDAAEELLLELIAAEERQYMRYFFLAHAAVSWRDDDQTLNWLEMACKQRDPLLVFLKGIPRFDSLFGLSRFRNLLRRIGLPAATNTIHRSSGLAPR